MIYRAVTVVIHGKARIEPGAVMPELTDAQAAELLALEAIATANEATAAEAVAPVPRRSVKKAAQ